MSHRVRFGIVTLAAVAGLLVVPLRADVPVSKADSDAMQRKILDIFQAGLAQSRVRGATAARTRLTPILERELNSYLRFELVQQVPVGVIEPTVTILGEGRLTGSAVVDLDEVKKAQGSSGMFDPMSYLGGKMPVTATGRLQTQNGTGRFLLESASLSGVPIPKAILQQVVGYYTRSAENPAGVNLDDAFELPARIQEIRVQPGQAIIVQ